MYSSNPRRVVRHFSVYFISLTNMSDGCERSLRKFSRRHNKIGKRRFTTVTKNGVIAQKIMPMQLLTLFDSSRCDEITEVEEYLESKSYCNRSTIPP